MSIRGFGTIESPALIDGHPVGQGVDLGFDFQDAPTFGLSSVFVGYGTDAASLYGVGGAGVIDMRTLSPTSQPVTDFLQGLGSYGHAATALKSTGSSENGKIGWAFTYGVKERKSLWRDNMTNWLLSHMSGDATELGMLQLYRLMADSETAFAKELLSLLRSGIHGREPLARYAKHALRALEGIQINSLAAS